MLLQMLHIGGEVESHRRADQGDDRQEPRRQHIEAKGDPDRPQIERRGKRESEGLGEWNANSSPKQGDRAESDQGAPDTAIDLTSIQERAEWQQQPQRSSYIQQAERGSRHGYFFSPTGGGVEGVCDFISSSISIASFKCSSK